MLQRFESTTGPVAVGGRTITLVARTHAVEIARPGLGLFAVRSRPAHVEVLDDAGNRRTVPVRDVQRILTTAIMVGTVACLFGIRSRRSDP